GRVSDVDRRAGAGVDRYAREPRLRGKRYDLPVQGAGRGRPDRARDRLGVTARRKAVALVDTCGGRRDAVGASVRLALLAVADQSEDEKADGKHRRDHNQDEEAR